MSKEKLREEFEDKFTYFDPEDNARNFAFEADEPSDIFNWFYSKIAEQEQRFTELLAERDKQLKAAEEVINIKDKYRDLLLEEIDSLVPTAYVHGWRSVNVGKGYEYRDKIKVALEKYQSLKNQTR